MALAIPPPNTVNMSTDIVWNEFSSQVLDYFLSRVGDRQQAEDLRQEVFLKIHSNISRLRQHENLGHWISVIMRNTLVDHWKQRPGESLRPELLSEGDENTQSPGRMVEKCIREMIGRLPEKYAQPLSMSDLEGVKQKEVAGRLNLSLSGAKSRIQRGRELLRETIQGCCRVELNARNEIVDYDCVMDTCGGNGLQPDGETRVDDRVVIR